MFILSAAACGSEGEATVPADLAATPAATSATTRSHTLQDPSCVAACETIVACLGGHGSGYGSYGDYGSYGGYGSYGDYGSYGGYGDYGSYGDAGSYGDYGSYGGNGSYGDYGYGYGGNPKSSGCVTSCQALPAPARRKIVACIGARKSCHEKLACE
jgi:peroxin-13